LIEKTPNDVYRERIEELTATLFTEGRDVSE
jgi:hypothetical protein